MDFKYIERLFCWKCLECVDSSTGKWSFLRFWEHQEDAAYNLCIPCFIEEEMENLTKTIKDNNE